MKKINCQKQLGCTHYYNPIEWESTITKDGLICAISEHYSPNGLMTCEAKMQEFSPAAKLKLFAFIAQEIIQLLSLD